MHIGIDARIYGAYHRGIGRYTERLISNLSRLRDDNRYTLFMDKENASSFSLSSGKFKIVKISSRHYSIKEHIKMPVAIKKSKVDVMHFTHFNAPLFCPVPYVVTIHDLIVHHFPSSRATTLPNWKYWLKLRGYEIVLKNALKKSKKIITVSEFSKRDIIKSFGVEEKKISVIYPGTDEIAPVIEGLRNTESFSRILEDKFKISKKYILYAGSAYPHKNLEKLIDAHRILKKDFNRDWQLVMVGRMDEFYEKIKKYASSDKDVIFTGHVSDKDLDGLYRGAKLFVFPSLYEGFGLPALEAASRGVPVILSKAGSLPEVMGDSAHYFDPESVESIALAIDRVGGSVLEREELIRAGFVRAKQFSWKETAEKTVEEYASIVL